MTYLLIRCNSRDEATEAFRAAEQAVGLAAPVAFFDGTPARTGSISAVAIHDDLDRIMETAREWATSEPEP